MRNKQCFTYLICLLAYFPMSSAQGNLLPNGNFEDVEKCFDGHFYNDISRYWFTPQDRVIALENPCFYGILWAVGNDTFGINKSKSGYFETYGFFTQLISISHHRAYLTTKLKQPLVANQQYYFEMSFRTLDTVPDVNWVTTDFTDGQDVAFSKDFPTYDWNQPNSAIELTPVLTNQVIKDYNWHKLKGCFKANGGEQYLLIGNFKTNSQTLRVPTGKRSKTQFVSSSHVVDNVVLTPVEVHLKDTAVCKGETAMLNVQNMAVDSLKYIWHDGSTTPQYKASKSEKISVQVIYPDSGCVARADMDFKVIEKDYQAADKDSIACKNEKVTFIAGTGIANETIQWDNGSKDRVFIANTEGVYSAQIKNQCATWTEHFKLTLQQCGLEVFVPTAFSPNADGVNDVIRPFIKTDYVTLESYDFKIFNRWGNLVFTSTNPSESWDGYLNSKLCESGMYVWTLKVQVVLNGKSKVEQLAGDVTMVR